MLVIGPNRVFLRYIERVLPSLGEAGVEQVVLADLVPDVRFAGARRPRRLADGGAGQGRRAHVGGDRQGRARPPAAAARRPRGAVPHRLPAAVGGGDPAHRQRPPGAGSAATTRPPLRRGRGVGGAGRIEAGRRRSPPARSARRVRHDPEVRAALERMWPVLTPAQLLHDLFGSPALLRLAAGAASWPTSEIEALHRPRSATRRRRALDGRRRGPARRRPRGARPEAVGKGGKIDEADEIRTYGHIVIDEAQDLTPMQLRMATRRSLNGSMTVVGDLAQATGPLAPARLGRRARPPARPQAVPRRRAHGRLPHPGADHGARRQGADGRPPGPAVADRGARRRRRARS